jgi:hypothetical protein
MKTKHYFISLMILLYLNFTHSVSAQQTQSNQQTDKLTKFYRSVRNPEISLQQFLKIQSQAASSQSVAAFSGCGVLHDLCGNGGFETGLDPNQWQGAYGTWASGDPDPASLTEGLVSGTGSLFDADAHQTVVAKDIDPIVGISTVSDSGGTQSLRLGNAITGFGTELISKTINVTASTTTLRFSYAVVFQDPGHPFLDQPAFSVRAFDCATGQELLNVCDLGNSSYKVVSDAANPFFQSINHPTYGLMAFRDWSSSFVDLSAYIGHTVNIQFTNKDCGQGAHFGYTYLDAFCEGGVVNSSAGSVAWNPSSDKCGNGSLCVDYTLGGSNGTTGTAVLHLGIYQNGALVTTLNSDTLTKDSSTYCFGINPSSLGLDNSAGGFDYVLNSDFQLKGFNYQLLPLGDPPYGQDSLPNNDYTINCGGPDTTCTHICLRDNYLYQWKLCYKKQSSGGMASGTVDIGGGAVWPAWGWMDCNTGRMELHAINPNPDCSTGYRDSFVYKGISITKCRKMPFNIGIGGGRWISYCNGNVNSMGNFGMITCLDKNQLNDNSSDQFTPAKSNGPAGGISLKASPNPTQNYTTISYSLTKESKVNIVVYNYMMQPVKTLESGTRQAGNYFIKWDARRSDGSSAGAGLYKIVATVNGKAYTTTVQVIK